MRNLTNACESDADCDDNVFCNGEETCNDEGQCEFGDAPDCDDGVACTVDVCDEIQDECIAIQDSSLCGPGEMCDPTDGCMMPVLPVDMSGLAGYWTFAGGDVVDMSGNGNDGESLDSDDANADGDTPALVLSLPEGGSALSFDGVDDYVEIPDSTSLDITGEEISVDARVYWRGAPLVGEAFVNKEHQFELGISPSTGQLETALYTENGTGWAWLVSGSVVPANQWVHLAFTYDGTDVVQYINGKQVSSSTHADGGGLHSEGYPLRFVGRDANLDDTLDNFGEIVIDEVRVWSRTLTPAEVLQMALWVE